MSTIVVLGGGGFIGGCIERHYRRLGWRVVAVGRAAGASCDSDARHVWDLPHSEFAHLLAVEQPDLCVNAAGRASVPASMVEPLSDFETSTLLNFRLLDDIRRRCPQTRYVHLSSAAVYGEPARLPVTEDADIRPISPYGWHKHLSERVLEEHSHLFGLRTASLRLFSAYGAKLRRQVVWDLAQRAAANPGRSLVLQGRPEDSRDFVHGTDVALAVETVAARGSLRGECYNLAGGTETRIGDLATMILRRLGRPAEIAFDDRPRPGNPSRWHADISRLQTLGFAPRVTLDAGVGEVVEDVTRGRGLTARAAKQQPE